MMVHWTEWMEEKDYRLITMKPFAYGGRASKAIDTEWRILHLAVE